jgi:hypothetical protein
MRGGIGAEIAHEMLGLQEGKIMFKREHTRATCSVLGVTTPSKIEP